MKEVVVGYRVKVQDCDPGEWSKDAPILYELDFPVAKGDGLGYGLGNALRRAEIHAQELEQGGIDYRFEGRYVEVDSIWGEENDV